MTLETIPVNQPQLDGNEKKYLLECIDSGWISSEGPWVKRFEDSFSKTVDRKYGIAVANGSLALDAAVVAAGVGHGDEVIVPTFTIISCVSAIIRAGATPVLVDTDSSTWNMDVTQIEKKMTARTKAILIVHTYGLPVDLDSVLNLACKNKLVVIEDAAQMHGQTYHDRPCGSFGDLSVFSFYSNKHVTTGEGGMIVTNDLNIAERCRSLRNLAFGAEHRFIHQELAWNMRMTSMQAAVGLAQLEKLDRTVKKKRELGAKYHLLLGGLTEKVELPPHETTYAKSVYWVFGLVLKDGVPFEAAEIVRRLAEHKIGSRPFFWPMHEQPALKKLGLFESERYPIAERLARRGFYIPLSLSITDAQMVRVANTLKEVLGA